MEEGIIGISDFFIWSRAMSHIKRINCYLLEKAIIWIIKLYTFYLFIPRWTTVNTTDLTFALNGLLPYTMYEFRIRVIRDGASSIWSMTTSNKTFEAGRWLLQILVKSMH